MLNPRASLLLLSLFGVFSACKQPEAEPPGSYPYGPSVPPTFQDESATDDVPKKLSDPVIVAWDMSNRQALLTAAARGIVVVKVTGRQMTVLPGCIPPGKYRYQVFGKREQKDLSAWSRESLHDMIPVIGDDIRQKVMSSVRVDITFTSVGRFYSDNAPTLVGAACQEATHYVPAYAVGAFDLFREGPYEAPTGYGQQPPPPTRERLRSDGVLTSCNDVRSSDTTPVPNCNAPLAVALAAVEDIHRGAARPGVGIPTPGQIGPLACGRSGCGMQAPISAGVFQTCTLTQAGGVQCWGGIPSKEAEAYTPKEDVGLLGNGTPSGSLFPVPVTGLSSGVKSVSAGIGHGCAHTSVGGVLCWGDNSVGQLGDGTTTRRLVPTKVPKLASGVAGVSGRASHTCVVTTSGAVQCWGFNKAGQLGNGTKSDSTVPQPVLGLKSGVVAVSSGAEHTCAITSAGGLLCWGDNSEGQLGDGTTTSRPTPTQVRGLGSGVVAVSAAKAHTCALMSAGGVQCWGGNTYGAIGDGTSEDRHIPTQVHGLTSGVVAVSAGVFHSCALTSFGAVRCWGGSFWGQETLNPGTIPSPVPGLDNNIVALSAGAFHTCVRNAVGETICWGCNDEGQLGNGTVSKRMQGTGPTRVRLAP